MHIVISVLVFAKMQFVVNKGDQIRYLLRSKTVRPLKAVHTSKPTSHPVSSLSEENKSNSLYSLYFYFKTTEGNLRLPLHVSIKLIP